MRIVLFLLVGCAGRAFADRHADAVCAWRARCETLEVAGFESEEACRSASRESVAEQDARGELGCDAYDETAATKCLAAYEEAKCGEEVDVGECAGVCG